MTHAQIKDSLRRYPSERAERVGDRTHGETMGRAWPECPLRDGSTKQRMAKRRRAKEVKDLSSERDRKLYPLRGRVGMGDVGTRSCRVLLTRLEESGVQSPGQDGPEGPAAGPEKQSARAGREGRAPHSCGKKSCRTCRAPPEPKTKPKAEKHAHPPAQEPRKRRLASLNAEAVNSLLLEREDPLQTARLAKKQQQQQQQRLNGERASPKDPPGTATAPRKGPEVQKADLGRKPKRQKKAKPEGRGAEQLSLDSPAPRRLAGLNAAALLKLTSASSGAKRRLKADCKEACGAAAAVRGKQPHPKSRKQQHRPHGSQQAAPKGGCTACKKEALHPEVEWEGTAGGHGFHKSGYLCRTILGYPLKPVKEEQTETEVNPFYCCGQDGAVEYCHGGLALFLGRQAYSELEDHAPSSLKQEFPPPPHSLAHPTLAIGTHPYPCFPGYYVHISHHGASSPPLSAGPVPYPPSTMPPITLCSGRVPSSKLMAPAVSHPSGIPNPAFCGSVGSPCFGEACRVSSYAYRAMQPLASRRCSFSTACSGCTHKIKTEEFPSSLEDRSPSIPVWPALPLSSCPVPSVPPAALQTLLSDPSQPQAQLRVARECPQSAKPPSGSRSGVRNSTGCPHAGHGSNTGKQQRISRRRATNGWLPVGVPTEKEVFIVGEEETALRRCYEGVQRDGEVIRVRDTVLLRSGPRKKSLPYVAKISALWEDPETGEMMMSLFWYYRPEHTQGGRNPSMHCENEIFASRHQDENSVACIEDKCYVLTLAQYCRFCALVKRRGEGLPESAPVVPPSPEYAVPAHRRVPANIDPDLVFLCRHVYDFRYGRILKNLQ
ncbi:bromo adjacent homology domain-containing 1 protein isoform X2 [Anguilla anguilla]|nr:bromo adjacent homology domain-containing 1 protein isoform X2 [Anguilla anguilla]XP_035285224.1 bromo adjacent homology domain-containing 1 protein isoform X2 [Anguilla anguilla]XP_035285231.1 bromo adjacent homology domain-containing 1 protein isoform X2 [Anguilla anguilla]XP_035285238.1 bromo adjacent homology domain-containing 1 protein isoform X2 [Anguilla anguilla]